MFQRTLRLAAFGNHFVVWVSSLIVTGILSFFLVKYNLSNNAHVIYQEVIATITLAVWTFGMVLPLVNAYGGHLWLANHILSYLWLTSFIFSAQDWAGGRCTTHAPTFGKCGLKKTVVAFNFFAFFFLLVNTFVEGLLFRAHRDERVHAHGVHKSRPNTTAHEGLTATGV
ncbi:hypothetical protein J3F83DRAFT_430847 [Trichoderma novae-zelandiae]